MINPGLITTEHKQRVNTPGGKWDQVGRPRLHETLLHPVLRKLTDTEAVLLAAWFSASSCRTMGSGAQTSASLARGSGMGMAACCLPARCCIPFDLLAREPRWALATLAVHAQYEASFCLVRSLLSEIYSH
jgi:hypothetical protein